MSYGGGDAGFFIGVSVGIGVLLLFGLLSQTGGSSSGLVQERPGYAPLAEHQTAPVEQLTSLSLTQLKRIIEATRSERVKIQSAIYAAKNRLSWAKFRHLFMIVLLSPLFLMLLLIPPIAKRLYVWRRRTVTQLEDEIKSLETKLSAAVITLDFDMVPEITAAFNDLEAAFRGIIACNAKWDITTEWETDQFRSRTTASRSLERKSIQIVQGDGPYIKSSRRALIFGNVTGTTIYIYPGFAMVTGGSRAFALVETIDLSVRGNSTRFIEDQNPPPDAEIISQTWLKANKDGSRDRRFSYNRQIPIMQYGELHFHSSSGINEMYLLSRAAPCIAFAYAFDALKRVVRRSSAVQDAPIIRSAPAISARSAPRI